MSGGPLAAPLEGVRVLDFTTAMAGPAASMLLADFGAEVLKVEPPEGESSRRWGSARFGPGADTSGLFLALNRNKASITLDLKSAEGAAAVERLVRESDVVMESFKPGVADRLGIGYERLAAMRPGLVYASVSGFGQTGPLREQPGYDQLLQAFAGHMSITGEAGPSIGANRAVGDRSDHRRAHGAWASSSRCASATRPGRGSASRPRSMTPRCT